MNELIRIVAAAPLLSRPSGGLPPSPYTGSSQFLDELGLMSPLLAIQHARRMVESRRAVPESAVADLSKLSDLDSLTQVSGTTDLARLADTYVAARVAGSQSYDFLADLKYAVVALTYANSPPHHDRLSEALESGAVTNLGISLPGLAVIRGWADMVEVAEHLKLRETTIGYELGDIARITNQIAEESRKLTRKSLTRQVIESEVTAQRTEEDESEVTDRSKEEFSEHIKDQVSKSLELSAGVHASGTVGVWALELASSFGLSQSTDRDRSTTERMLREVTARASSATRVSRSTRTRTATTDEQRTRDHQKFGNSTSSHRRAVYRWLDRRVCVETVRYDNRLLLDMTVAEPGQQLRLMHQQAGTQAEASDDAPLPLSPEGITRSNWHLLAARLEAAIPEPPARYIAVNGAGHRQFTDKRDPWVFPFEDLMIPDGYEAFGIAIGTTASVHNSSAAMASVSVAGMVVDLNNVHGIHHGPVTSSGGVGEFDPRLTGTVTGFVHHRSRHHWAGTVNVLLKCELSLTKYQEWQRAAFIALSEALADSAEGRASAERQQLRAMFGYHPREAERRIVSELKRLCLLSVGVETGSSTGVVDGQADPTFIPPTYNDQDARAYARLVRFVEDGFEWGNLVYAFHDYWWGRTGEWSSLFHGDHPSDLVSQFLRAGSARVVVPVRPGFEEAMLVFISTGIPFLGADGWGLGDPLYVSIIETILENRRTDPDDGCIVASWDERVATDLVALEVEDSLPPAPAEAECADPEEDCFDLQSVSTSSETVIHD